MFYFPLLTLDYLNWYFKIFKLIIIHSSRANSPNNSWTEAIFIPGVTYLRFYQSYKSLQWHIHYYTTGLQLEKRCCMWCKGNKMNGRKAKTKAQYWLDWWNQNPTRLHQYWRDHRWKAGKMLLQRQSIQCAA